MPVPNKVILLIATLALTGCGATRNASAEKPVDLQLGQYKFTFSGAFGGIAVPTGNGPGSQPKSGCVTQSLAEEWPKPLIRDAVAATRSCNFENVVRTGNAVSGDYVCEADQGDAQGLTMTVSYKGDMSATDTRLETQMKMKIPDSMMENLPPDQRERLKAGQGALGATTIIIAAERTGDCS